MFKLILNWFTIKEIRAEQCIIKFWINLLKKSKSENISFNFELIYERKIRAKKCLIKFASNLIKKSELNRGSDSNWMLKI